MTLPLPANGSTAWYTWASQVHDRTTNPQPPASHTHGVTDLTATGTRDATTYLRGDNTWAAPAGGTSYTDEQAQDAAAALLTGQTGKVSATYNDAGNAVTLGLSATGTASSTTFLRGDNTWAAPAGGASTSMWVNVKDYGAVGDWTTDDTAAINSAIAAVKARTATSPVGMEPRVGGIVFFPPGFYKVTSTIVLDDNDIHLVGEGKVATQIIASGLTSGSAVIKIGKKSGGTNTFGCTVENMKIDVNGVTNGVGVYTPNGQEGTGMRGVRITNYKDAGFRAGTDGTGDPAAEVRIVECEFWSSFGGSNYALDFANSNGVCYVDTISIIGFNSASVNTTAVHVSSCKVNVKNVHVEGYGNGLVVDANAEVRGEYIMGGNGPGEQGGNSALVYVDADAGGVFEMLRAGATGVPFISEKYGYTIPEGIVYRVAVLQVPVGSPRRDLTLGTHTGVTTDASIAGVVAKSTGSNAQPTLLVEDGADVTSFQVNANGLTTIGRSGNTQWSSGHLVLGAYHLWVDSTGKLRIKSSAPASDTDGTVVGTQT